MAGRIARLGAWAAVALAVACGPARPTAPSPYAAEGALRAVDGGVWVVGREIVVLAGDAAIVGVPAVGSLVRVTGTREPDGWAVARRVEVVGPAAAVATAAPTPTAPPPAAPPTPTRPPPASTAAPPPVPALRPTEPAKPEPAERARKPEPSAKGDDREKKEKKGD